MGLNVPRVDLNIDKQDSCIFTMEIDNRFKRKIHCYFMNISRRKMFQNKIIVSLILFLFNFFFFLDEYNYQSSIIFQYVNLV